MLAVLQHRLVSSYFGFSSLSISFSFGLDGLPSADRWCAGPGWRGTSSVDLSHHSVGNVDSSLLSDGLFPFRPMFGRDRSIIIGSVAARGSGDGHHPPGRSPERRSPVVAGSVPSSPGLCSSYWQAPGTSASFGILESSDRVFDCAIFGGQRYPPPVAAIGNYEPFRAYQHYGFLLCGPAFYCLPGIRWAGHQWHSDAECHASWVCRVHFWFSGFREFQWGPPLGMAKEYLPILRVKDGVPLRSLFVIVVKILQHE